MEAQVAVSSATVNRGALDRIAKTGEARMAKPIFYWKPT
jgi:hypothetical protein